MPGGTGSYTVTLVESAYQQAARQHLLSRTCIICGKAAGSKEHIFPAALGGRRTNKGIYCGPHNNGFSGLAGIISAQLKPLNALLSVRPDHASRAMPFDYLSPNGEQLTIFNGKVKRAHPATSRERDELRVELELGGPKGLKAVSYIALTFFAHHFPDLGRSIELQPLKDFITGSTENNFVWWERTDILEPLPANPFQFGHAIVVQTSASSSEMIAVVSLFQSFNFAIRLGKNNEAEDRTVVVFIDPHADHPPDDIVEHVYSTPLVELKMPVPLHAHLEKLIHDQVGQSAVQALTEKIERWNFANEMAPFRDRLNAARRLPNVQLIKAVEECISEETSRVYRLMVYVATEFTQRAEKTDISAAIAALLEKFVEVDENDSLTLAPIARARAEEAMQAVAQTIMGRLETCDLDMEFLWKTFRTGHGASIVAKTMFAPIIKSLGVQF